MHEITVVHKAQTLSDLQGDETGFRFWQKAIVNILLKITKIHELHRYVKLVLNKKPATELDKVTFILLVDEQKSDRDGR